MRPVPGHEADWVVIVEPATAPLWATRAAVRQPSRFRTYTCPDRPAQRV
jgi:hypothetical protein